MRNRGKRYLVLLLSVLMLLSQMSSFSFAAVDAEGSDTANDKEAVVAAEDVDAGGEAAEKDGGDTVGAVAPAAEEAAPAESSPEAEESKTLKASSKRAAPVDAKASEDEPAGSNILINVNNATDKDIRVYGFDKSSGKSGEYTAGAGKTLQIGLVSIEKIYSQAGIKITDANGCSIEQKLKTTGKSDYAYEVDLKGSTFSSGCSFKVVPDDNYWTVSFMPNGGDGSMMDQLIVRGKSAVLRENRFSWDNHVFEGWSTDENATEATYKDKANFEPKGNTKLYAVWSEYVHVHDWNPYSGGKDKMYLECRNTKDCEYGTIEMTLVAVPREYDGTAFDDFEVQTSLEPGTEFPEGFVIFDDPEYKGFGPEFYKDGNKLSGPPKDVGVYTVKVFLTDTRDPKGNKVVAEAWEEFSIYRKTGLTVTADDQTVAFGEEEPELTYTVQGLAQGDSPEDVFTGTLEREPGSGIGTYAINKGSLEANGNYEITFKFNPGKFTIAANTASVTKKPVAKQGLVYNRKAQPLIEAGAAKGGTMYYFKGSNPPEGWEDWSTEIPTGTDAKEFDIWYKVKGDVGYNDLPARKIKNVSIGQKTLNVVWSDERLSYNGEIQAPAAKLIDPDTDEEETRVVPVITGDGKDVNIRFGQKVYTAAVSLNGKDASNYVLENSKEYYRIYPKKLEIVWKKQAKFEYDGTAKAPAIKEINGVIDGEECPVSIEIYAAASSGRYDLISEAVDVGSYMAVPFSENGNYYAADVAGRDLQEKEFSITKASIQPSVTLEGWTYGDPANEPEVTGNPGGAVPVFTYSVSGSSVYTETPPTEASKDDEYYIVRAVLPETKNYQGGVAEANFTIAKAELEDFEVSIDGWKYRTTPSEPEVTGNYGDGEVSFTYYKKASADAETGEEITGKLLPGYYYVIAEAEETDNYLSGEARADFVVSKGDIEYTAPSANPELTAYTGSEQELIVPGSVDNTSLKMSYSLDPEGEFTEDAGEIKGKDAGTYRVWYQVKGNGNYEGTGILGPVNVTIKKADPEYTKPDAVENTYDGSEHELITAGSTEDGHFEYSLHRYGGYSINLPKATNAGDYTVYYRVVGDKNHANAGGTVKSSILKGKLKTKVLIGNWREGEEAREPELSNNPEGAEVTFKYRPADGGKKDLVDEAPTVAGDYTVVAEIGETKNYEARTAKENFKVADEPVAPTGAEGLEYNGSDQALITAAGDAGETGTMMYSLDGETYFEDFNVITGKNAGKYNVWYYIKAAEGYLDTEPQSIEVSISVVDAVITKYPAARTVKYNGEQQQLVTAGLVSDSTMLYNLDSGRYGIGIPKATAAGDYVVGYKAVGDSNHKDVYGFVSAKIGKAEITPVVDIEGWTYGDDPYVPEVSGYYPGDEIDEDDVTYEYKPANAADEEYSTDVPEDAGDYVVRATIAENDNYAEAVSEPTPFTIEKAEISPKIMILGWKEGDYTPLINDPVVYGNKGEAEVTYLYKEKDADDSTYAEFDPANGKPEAEGKYVIKAVVAESDNYNGAETNEFSFAIRQANPEIDIPPEAIEGLTYMSEDGEGIAQYLVYPGVATNDKGYFKYYVTTKESFEPNALTGFSEEIPQGTDAGTYYVWYRLKQKRTLLPDKTVDEGRIVVTIDKAEIDPGVEINGWAYKRYNILRNLPKLTEGSNPGNGKVAYYYKKQAEGDDKYSKIEPVLGDAGEYVVKAVIEETRNYYGGTATAEFSIRKAAATALVLFPDDLVYNGEYQKLVSSAVAVGGDLEYSVDGGNFTSLKPTALHAGIHQVTYRLIPDKNHYIYSNEKTAEVEIAKAPIKPSVKLGSWTYGEEPKIPEVSGAPSKAEVSFMYRAKGDEDYSPINEAIARALGAGDYELKAVVGETRDYESGEAVTEFSVAKAQAAAEVEAAKGLVYNGSEQCLLTKAEATGGTLEFKGKDGKYSKDDSVIYQTSAGEYKITYRVVGDANHKDLKPVTVTVSIDPLKVSGFTWSAAGPFVYDGKAHGVTATAEGVMPGDEVRVEVKNGEAAAAGDYKAVVNGLSGKDGGNYCFDAADPTASLEWKITKAKLAVTANDNAIAYGMEPANAGVSYSGFAEGDSPDNALKGSMKYKYSYVLYGKPGTYSITPGGVTSDNYDINFRSGKLTVSDVEAVLVAQAKAAGKSKARVTWNQVTGADSYAVYFAKCDTAKKKNKLKKVATVSGGKLTYTRKKLKKNTCYKFRIDALSKGKVIASSSVFHVAGGNVYGKYTNAKSLKLDKYSVSINKGESVKVKATVAKAKKGKKLLNNSHEALIRYRTSNPAIATVNGNGTIYGVGTGYCKVYVQSVNGLWQTVEVAVN